MFYEYCSTVITKRKILRHVLSMKRYMYKLSKLRGVVGRQEDKHISNASPTYLEVGESSGRQQGEEGSNPEMSILWGKSCVWRKRLSTSYQIKVTHI